jgi:hypothetical protein
MRKFISALFVSLLGFVAAPAMAQEALYSKDHHGWVDTPTAGSALKIGGQFKAILDKPKNKYVLTFSNGWAENHSVLDNARGQISINVSFSDGRIEQLVSACDENPGRGLSGPTGRGCNDVTLEFVGKSATIIGVTWEFKNLNSGSLVLDVFKVLVSLVLSEK